MLVLLLACTPETPEIPDRTSQSPLEDENRAPAVPATPDDSRPEAVVVDSGFQVGNLRWWSHARAWIHADTADVWAALRVPEVMADRRVLESWSVDAEDHRPDVDHSFLFASEMQLPGRLIEFDITWLHTVESGDLESPDLVVATWDVSEGPPFLDGLAGSIELEQIEPGLTELRGIYHIGAASHGPAPMNRYWEDLHAELLATLDGEPLPSVD